MVNLEYVHLRMVYFLINVYYHDYDYYLILETLFVLSLNLRR